MGIVETFSNQAVQAASVWKLTFNRCIIFQSCFKSPSMDAMSSALVFELLGYSKLLRWMMKFTLVLGALQNFETMKISNKNNQKSTRIIVSRLTKCQKGIFCLRICKWNVLPQFYSSSALIESKNIRLNLRKTDLWYILLTKVIAIDESWCYGCVPAFKQESSKWDTLYPTHPKQNKKDKCGRILRR